MSADSYIAATASSPDQNANGLVPGPLDPLRYESHAMDSDEVSGIFASMIPARARVLDVGCGTGSLTKILADSCRIEIVGIEPDRARRECAIARGLTVHVGPLTPDLRKQIGCFDVVLFADVLEHLPDPQALLLVSRRFLNPKGAVIVSVPNVAHWSVRLEILQGRFRYRPSGIMDATHLRWFTAESARSLLASAGFKTVEYRATAGFALFENLYRAPLCWVASRYRTSFLRIGSRRWPTLFGCQHVLKAEML